MPKFLKEWVAPWRAYVAEFLGTFVFVTIASGAVLSNVFYGDVGSLGIAFATGLSLALMIYATFHISGGHLNPAVTLALWLTQKISSASAIFYILAQVAASFAAATFLLYLYGDRAMEFVLGAPVINTPVHVALVVEAFLSAVLVFVVFATLVDRRGQSALGPLLVGLVVVVGAIAAGTLSGAVLNPARVLGPLIISETYDYLIVWVAGPAAGSLFGVVYDFLFLKKRKK